MLNSIKVNNSTAFVYEENRIKNYLSGGANIKQTNHSFDSFLESGLTTSASNWTNLLYLPYASGIIFLSAIKTLISIFIADNTVDPYEHTTIMTYNVEVGYNTILFDLRVKLEYEHYIGINVPNNCVYYKSNGGVGIIGYPGWEMSYWVFDYNNLSENISTYDVIRTNTPLDKFENKTLGFSFWCNNFSNLKNICGALVNVAKSGSVSFKVTRLSDIGEYIYDDTIGPFSVSPGINTIIFPYRISLGHKQQLFIETSSNQMIYYEDNNGIGYPFNEVYPTFEISYNLLYLSNKNFENIKLNIVNNEDLSTIVNGYWIDGSQNITEASTTAHRKIDISDYVGKYISLYYPYYHEQNISPENAGGIRFEDDENNKISGFNYICKKASDNYGEYYYLSNIKVPQNAKYFYFNVKFNWFNDVNDTIVQVGNYIDRGIDCSKIDGTYLADRNARLKIYDIQETLSKINTNDWSNFNWAVIGDSLTEHNYRTNYNYHDYVSSETGINVYNLGHSGVGYFSYFYHAYQDIPADTDVITIFGSINDMPFIRDEQYTIGEITDTQNTTYCGFVNTTISTIIRKFPTVPLGIVTPCPCHGSDDSVPGETPMTLNCILMQMADKLKLIAHRWSLPVLDIFYESDLHPEFSYCRSVTFSKDDGSGCHPDEVGHAILAPKFKMFVSSLLKGSIY